MSNDINDLRSTLFETLQELKDGKMDLDRAKVINDTAQVIINTAKAEVDFMKVTGANSGTDFIPLHGRKPALPPGVTETPTGTKVVDGNVTTHKLR